MTAVTASVVDQTFIRQLLSSNDDDHFDAV